jgi:hypothetical protein
MLTENNTICIASPKYRVMSDDMMILNDLASKYNWKDVEVFGQGDMIGSLVVANHWTLTPADYYQYSIPIEAMQRIYLAHKAGVQIKGVVIADDERKPTRPPARQLQPGAINLVLKNADQAGAIILKMLLGIAAVVVGAIVISALAAILLAIGLAVLVIAGVGAALVYDPKCIILIDDGMGGTIWVSLYTWWE